MLHSGEPDEIKPQHTAELADKAFLCMNDAVERLEKRRDVTPPGGRIPFCVFFLTILLGTTDI